MDKTSFGTIKKLKAKELDNWLVFNVDFVTKRKEEREVEVLKCEFKDEGLKKFLLNTINNYKNTLGTGNLLYKILSIKIPCFDRNHDKNKLIIDKMMKEYLMAVEKREQLENEIENTDDLINKEVYKSYGLDEKEIRLVDNIH